MGYKSVVFTSELIKLKKGEDKSLIVARDIDGNEYKEGKLLMVKGYKANILALPVITPLGRSRFYLEYLKQNEKHT